MRFLRQHHGLLIRRLLLLLGLLLAQPAQAGEADLLRAVNAERANHGLALLQADAQLRQAAQAHADDLPLCGRLSHDGCDDSDLRQRLRRASYAYAQAAENIALGTPDAAATLAAWLNSPGHRANLLRPDLREAGLGLGQLNGQILWVLVLGRRI